MDRTPRRHEAGSSVKAGTAAALITDHERKAVVARVPYFHVLDGTNDAGELHGIPTALQIRGLASHLVLALLASAQSKDTASVLKNIARSWVMIAGQIDRYAALMRDEAAQKK
jgi:hypothetical protein